MKPTYYNILFLLVAIPSIALGYTEGKTKGKYTKQKSLNKEFSVTKNALLKINNDYGNLDITSWDEDRIVFEITITVNGNDEEKVLQKLENIDVEFEASPQLVSAQTIFNKQGKSWWGKFTDKWDNNHLKMEINYSVKIPITNNIHLNNDYGTITLDTIKGEASIHCDYGQIIIGELLGDSNTINIDYTNNSTILYMKNGKINADYSDFILKNGNQIELNADYSQSKITTVKEINYNCDYGGLHINKANIIKGNGDYLDTNIGAVSKEININSDYGSIDIASLQSTTQQVTIRTDYTGVRIGYTPTYDFNYIIKTSYGGIKLDEDITIMKKSSENSNKSYQGYRGDKNSSNRIDILTNYGSVKLKKN